MSKELIEKCYNQIILTKTHKLVNTELIDAKYLLDFDLEVLSRPWDLYKVYSAQIRSEYWMYTGWDYIKGRKAALNKFLEREEIYYTKYYKEKEDQARINIEREIKEVLVG